MANSLSFLPTRVLTYVRFSVSALVVAFLCGSSLWADYNAATADLSSDWTVTNANGVTLDGSVLSSANHTGALTISSDPTFTLTNGAVFEQSGVITSNKIAIVVQGGGTLKITSASDLNSQAKGLWGFHFYDGSVVDTSGAGFMCLNGTSNNVRFYEDGELIIGTNMWTKTTTEIHAYAGANAKLTQSTAQGISDDSGLNLSTSGSVTFNVEQNATLTSTAKIYDEGSTGSIAKTGAGSLTLSGSLTYNVPTTVSDGTLLFSCDTLPKSVMTVSGGTLVLGTARNTITALDGTSIKADGGAVRVDGNLNINSGVLTAQGDWTGNGAINVKSGTQLRINSSFNYPNDITLKGGILRNAKDNPEATIYAPVNVESDSTMQAGWSKVFSLNGALKGSGNITIPEDSGYVRFSGDASAYTGSLIVASKGKIRIGVHGTDTTNSKAFIGPNAITLNGGTIMNTNNNLTVNNDLILSSESYFQAGWEKNLTLSGSITGSGKLHVLSDSGWVIVSTTCTDNSFTGSVHTDNDSDNNKYGLLKLGTDNPLGTNAGEARIWGTLDLNGHKQTFAGLANSDTTSAGKVKGNNSSVLTLKLNKNASKVYGGVFEGALNLVLTGDGTGTQIFKKAPAYTGNTTVEAGTLQLDAGGNLRNLSGAGTINFGSKTLTLSNSVDTTFSGSLSGSGEVSFANSKSNWIVMATTCENNSFTGQVVINCNEDDYSNQGRVRLGKDYAFGTSAGQARIYGTLDMNGYSQIFNGLYNNGDKGTIFNNTESLSTLTIDTTGKDVTFQSSITGAIALVITGTGKQTLSKAPEYTGATTVESGTLVLSAGGSLNNLSGSGTIDTEGQALTLNNTTPTEFSGVISDTGYVTKTGAEKLTLSGANDYSGGTSISEGRIVLTGNGTLGTGDVSIEANATLEFAHESEQNVSNYIYGNGSVIKSGSGVLTLSNGSYLGETTVSGGTLIVPSTASLATSKVTVKSGATLQTGASLYGAVDIQSGGTLDLDIEPNAYFYLGSLSLDEGKINFDFYDSNNNIYDNINVYNSADLSSGVINLAFNGSSSDDWRSVINDNYSGALPLISGIFENYSTAFNTNALDVYVNGSPSTDWKLTADLYGLYLSPKGSSGDSWYYANTNDINANSWTIDGTNKQGVQFKEGSVHSQTFVNPVHMSAAGSFDIGSGYDLTISGVIDGSGAVTKTGAGMLTLSANNSYSGGTTIIDGTLKLTDGGTLGSGNVTNNANLEIATNAGMNFSKAVSGSGTLTKTGTGVLRYSGAGTYSGGTIISEGAIRWDAGGELGTGPITLATANTDLRFSGGLTKTVSNDISGPGKLTKQGASGSPTVTLEGNLSGFTGTLITNEINGNRSATIKLKGNNTNLVNANEVINNGTIDVSEYTGSTTMQLNKLSGAGNVKVGSNAIILNNAENANTTFSGVISGSGSVTKTGVGTMTLSGANTYTGATTVSGGMLLLTGSLASPNVTVESNATFQTGTNLASTNVTLNGGSFVIGTTDASATIQTAALTMTDGVIYFDFNGYTSSANDYDKMFATSAALTSGTINLAFNNNDESAWLNNATEAGYVLIDSGSMTANLDNVQLIVGNAAPENWYLATSGNNLVLMKVTPPEPYYYANTTDITDENWTIDGTNKLGVKFTEGGDSATFNGGVTLSSNGEFEVGTGRTLTVSNVISGDGALTKTGEGTLELSGNNTFTGGTTVSDGTLTLNLTFNDGTKGNLAIGSTVTVDGATSVLAGHGDILGYSSGSVGTINLQNYGTLHNDSTGNHITVGAVINMTNGIISSEEGWGNDTFGNFVFDNAINVLGGQYNEISAWKITLRQYTGTSDEEVGGKITVVGGAKLTISSQIAAHNSAELVPLVKLGDGELVLSGDCTYTTGTYVYGGKLTLTKPGDKGTLATGSTVTVEGATSVLTGHGDILGYGGKTVGTINLQKGGTLHNDATAEQAAHITVGAEINMNSGFITADPDAWGSDGFGNYVFDNAINVTGGTNNEISANKITIRQYGDTPGNGGGKFTVADGAKLTVSSVIAGGDVPLVKLGDGELVLSASNTYSKGTTLSKGKITLTKTGTLGTGPVENSALIEFAQNSDVTIGNAISGTGSVIKTGTGEVTMSGDSDYTGGTTVNAGKLTLTKRGEKGTLATGGVVTVDGATSILAGHGDIFGYGADTLGTVNLQNNATLYNDSDNQHITVGAAINMNSGFITADPSALGDRFGNYVFDNAINVTGGTNNSISANVISLRQYGGTPGDSGGKITVADSAKLTIGSIIIDPDSNYVPLVKQGDGELVLTANNTYSTGTTISKGMLTLAGTGTTGAGTVDIAGDGTLNFYVTAEEDFKQVDVTNANAISGTGKIVKSGDGVLRFYNENAEGSVKANSFTVKEGRLDYRGFFNGNIVVDGGILSPGNSVGTLNVTGNFAVTNGRALFEFDSFDSGQSDLLNILGDGSFTAGASMIELSFLDDGDAANWAASLDEDGYRIVFDDGFTAGNYSSWLYNYTNLFGLTGKDDGLYLVAAAAPGPGSGVPEPSTWALLILSVFGLLYWRKRS